jgi:hypothetical protein
VLINIEIVPAPVLSEITEIPLLKHALRHAEPAEEEPKRTPTVRFLAGAAHDYVQIMLDARTSRRILLDIEKHLGKYPALQGEIHEIRSYVSGGRSEQRHR